jgi:exopolyphosphatase / guanosine-5'-triphosphate,3'-diphosphate pyrophosphatase
MDDVKVGVVDVGSNTVRLLVADVRAGEVDTLHEERAYLGLGAELLAHGRVRRSKLRELARVTEGYAAAARGLGVRALETVVTAPGRQGDPDPLLAVLARSTEAPVRVAPAEEEGQLAFAGALSRAGLDEGVVAVCDVGGGSTELVVGTPLLGPAWVRSVDVGSLRLTAAHLHGDPPSPEELTAAAEVVGAGVGTLTPPRPEVALATGGSARAVAKAVGGPYGPAEIDRLLERLLELPATAAAAELGLRPERARTLAAGALVLRQVSALLGVPFTPARGGIREGAALALAAHRAAA